MIGRLTIARRGYRQLWVPCICSAVTRFLPMTHLCFVYTSVSLFFLTLPVVCGVQEFLGQYGVRNNQFYATLSSRAK